MEEAISLVRASSVVVPNALKAQDESVGNVPTFHQAGVASICESWNSSHAPGIPSVSGFHTHYVLAVGEGWSAVTLGWKQDNSVAIRTLNLSVL